MEANIAVLTLKWFEVKPIKRYKCNLTKMHLKLYQKYNDIKPMNGPYVYIVIETFFLQTLDSV